MAKKFAGFTPEQLGKIDPSLQGKQSDEQNAIISSNPALAARVGKMAMAAQKRINMAYGGMVKKGFATGGWSIYTNPNNGQVYVHYNGKPVGDQDQGFIDFQKWKKENEGNINTTFAENNSGQTYVYYGTGDDYRTDTGKSGAYVTSTTDTSGNTTTPNTNTSIGTSGNTTLTNTGNTTVTNTGTTTTNTNTGTTGEDQTQPTTLPEYTPTGDVSGNLDAAKKRLTDARDKLNQAMAASQANPEDEVLAQAVTAAQSEVNSAQVALDNAQSAFQTEKVPSAGEVRDTIINDPESVTTTADVETTTEEQKEAGTIEEGTGQVDTKTEADVTTVGTSKTVDQPTDIETKTYAPIDSEAPMSDILERIEEVTGKVGAEALVDAQKLDPSELAQLGLTAAQIEKAQTVQGAPTRVLEDGELISGSTVDMDRVKKETNFEAATGQPSENATVQGQLNQLMADFEGTNPPPWAAGALRAAASMMASRGLSASSMAGQAAVQAAMEAALPIANADAQTFARFEQQNLSNRQQSAMFAAEQRAKFLGLEFTQDFQTKVANAAKISDIANMNFTAEQQVALENARMAQSVDLANLQAANAKVLSDAAAMTQLDLTNLSNAQQAAVQNAKTFLQMDLTNLNFRQQDKIFKAQSMVNALLTDTAAENAARQFNAASENQTEQFMANLTSQISMFNSEQFNLMEQFNAGQTNAMSQFNANLEAAREQFNATNSLVIAQANANWAQAYTLADNAAINASNRDAAMFTNELTMAGYNNILQYERDSISYAFKAYQNEMQRELQLLLEQMRKDVDLAKAQANIDMKAGEARGAIEQIVFNKVLDWVF